MNLGFAKIFSIFSSASISAGNFLCEAENLVDTLDTTKYLWESIVNWFLTILGNVIYFICQFALSLIDVFQVVIYKFLGVTTKIADFQPYDPNNPLIKFLTNDTVIEVLRTATTVAVVLVIVFTIFAIIKGEWDKATKDTEYSIKMVWSRAFRALFGMVIFPAAFMAVVILVNSLLASFSFTLSNGNNASLGGQVFAMCSYDANVYRSYAKNNKRIPIYIDFYDPYADGTMSRYTTEELAAIYDAFSTDGTELYNVFATENFLSFADSTSYNDSNNSITNDYKAYGEFEKFICTAEQYYVMADFIDYAVSNGITYYYKPISDNDIDWKYVDSSIFNEATGSLTLTYRDASNIANGKSYTITYDASPYGFGSPVQNALGTLSTLLSLDGNYYSMIDYLEGSINKVAWATNKVKLKLSDNYNRFDYVYEEYNNANLDHNTVKRYSDDDGDGIYTYDGDGDYVYIDGAYEEYDSTNTAHTTVQKYKANDDGTYTEISTIYVEVNGNKEEFDPSNADHATLTKYIRNLDGTYTEISTIYVRNLNKIEAQWTVQDQILLYEYYRYTYNNAFANYSINDLEQGIELDAYKLECKYYRDYTNSYITLITYNVAIINGTYYLVEKSDEYDAYGDPYYQIVNGDEKRQVLNNFSKYNAENNKEVGVHIVALDGTNHKFITSNSMKYDDNAGQIYFEDANGDYVFVAGGYVSYDENNSQHLGLQRYKLGENYIAVANGGYVYSPGNYEKYDATNEDHNNLDRYKADHFVTSQTGEYVYYSGEYRLLSEAQNLVVGNLPRYKVAEEGEDPRGLYIYKDGKYYIFDSLNPDHSDYKKYLPTAFEESATGAYVNVELSRRYQMYDSTNPLHKELTQRYVPKTFAVSETGKYVYVESLGEYQLYDEDNEDHQGLSKYAPETFEESTTGTYVCIIDSEYQLYDEDNEDHQGLSKYAPKDFKEDSLGLYVKVGEEYYLYDSENNAGVDTSKWKRYSPRFERNSEGEYILYNGQYVLPNSVSIDFSNLQRYAPDHYTKATNGGYVYIAGVYEVYDESIHDANAQQYKQVNYIESLLGEYVYNATTEEFENYNAATHAGQTRYTKYYVATNATEDAYVYLEDRYIECTEVECSYSKHFSPSYVEDDNGSYVYINNKFIAYDESKHEDLQRYNNVQTNVVNTDFTNTNITECWYSAVYNMQNEPTECTHLMTDVCLADTKGVKFGEVRDEYGIKTRDKYGFVNANGFWQEVDKLVATKNVKEVDWAHKLMGDLKEIYRDLNLEQLITTGEWLTEFNSNVQQDSNRKYVASFDTSLISPQGLIFSEVFLGIIKESDGSNLANYMFASKYSEEQRKELILALCGVEDYETASQTIEYFIDTFNLLFTPLLEKIMIGEGQDFIEGEVTNVQLYTYKAYLCSLLLSTDSATFFNQIASHLAIMYQFPYDVRITQPNDYTLAVNLIKEYLYYASIDTTTAVYKDNPDTEAGEIKYSYDLSRLEDIFERYLDSDGSGQVENTDIETLYGGSSASDITLDKTPKKLLTSINEELSEVYLSFADIVIKEYFNNDIYYGISSDKLKDHGIAVDEDEDIDWNHYGLNINAGKVEFASDNYHTFKQLPNYSELCNVIYFAIRAEFDSSSPTCRMVQIYNTVKKDLEEQRVDEDSKHWPTYMQIYKTYLRGENNYVDDSKDKNDKVFYTEVIFSDFISTTGVKDRLDEYDTYVKKYTKAMKQLKKTDFVVTLLKCMDISNILVDELNAMISYYTFGVFNNVIKPEHVDKILKCVWVDDIARFIGNLAAGLAGSITGEEITRWVYDLFKDLHGIDGLLNDYYNDADTIKLMTKDEFKTYSKVNSGVKGYESADIQRGLDAYKKQMRVSEQLQYIIEYAYDEDLVADVVTQYGLKDIDENGYQVPATNKVIAEPFIQYLQELSINWSQTMSAHRTMQEYHKYFITYAVRMNSTENASKTFKFIVNNHAYESTLTMPTAKLTEYVLGGTYLDYLGFETAYVNKNYTGFFDIDYNGADHIERPQPNTDEVTFNSITDLLNNIAKTTMQSYYLSNLKKVTKSNLDNIKLKERTFSGTQYQYLQLVLDSVKEYLAEEDDNGDIKYDLFNNLTKSGTCDNFDNVFGYLTGAKKEYASMTAKDFRLELMQAIIDYQPDSASTEKQNQKRFLALFYVYCSDFVEQTGQKYVNIGDNYVEFDENNSDHLPLKKFLFNANGTAEEASVLYMLDTTTKGLIMELAGIKDHPDEMLVGLEYEDVGKYFEGYDENNGDYFIVCTFDEDSQMYIPFMMNSGSTLSAYKKVDAIVDGKTTQISWTDLGYGIARTDYYCYYDKDVTSGKLKLVDKAFPIIAKGIITPDGMPTAIRQINGVTEFYRDNLIIRNASELNLSAYYMSTENLSVNYNFFSMITNTVSKVFTGKTLVEHAYGNIPRFSIDSHIRLPIGVDDEVISLTNEAISANYNFRNLSGLSTQHFYKIIDINFLMMIIAIIALFPLIIKAIYGVFGRIVDITVYYCMSPVMMSTIALGKNADKGKEVTPIYSEWMKKLTQKTLSVFGYVFGFQVFFIIVPFLAGIDFISQDAFNGLLTLNKMMPFLQEWGYIVINRFINLVFVICSAYLITEAPSIFADILGQSNGFKDGESLKGNIKATVNEVKEVVNGTRAVNAINYAKESLKENLGVNTIQDIGGRIKKTGAKISAKASEMRLRANGISKQEAKKVTKAMYQAVEDEVNNKKMLRDEVKYKAFDAYHQQIGMGGDTHTKELQEIDQKLYEAGLRNRTEKQQKAVQSQYSKRIKDEAEEKKKAKKEKGKKK